MVGDRPVSAASATVGTEFGTFELKAYEFADGAEHFALVAERPDAADGPPLVRLQSACITGTAFHALMCDCRQQLHAAMEVIDAAGGVVVYLDQEGRGHGAVEKVHQLDEIAHGANTHEAALRRGVEPDVRRFDQAVAVVHDIVGVIPVRFLTNNPDKLHRVRTAGLMVAERVALEPDPTPTNRSYLTTKKNLMGHLLTKV